MSKEALSLTLHEMFLNPPLPTTLEEENLVSVGRATVAAILSESGPLKLIHDYGFSPELLRAAKEDIDDFRRREGRNT
jgi:hypothetical protein